MEWLMEMPIEDIIKIIVAILGIIAGPTGYIEYKRRQSVGQLGNKLADIESAHEVEKDKLKNDLEEIRERQGLIKVVGQMAEGQRETAIAIKDLVTEIRDMNSANRETSQALMSSIEVQTMSVQKLDETVSELKTELVTVSQKLDELLTISRNTQKDIKPFMADAIETIASAVGLIEKAMPLIEKLTADADNEIVKKSKDEKDDKATK